MIYSISAEDIQHLLTYPEALLHHHYREWKHNHPITTTVLRSAEQITRSLPSLQDIYTRWCRTKAGKILKVPTHPNNRLLQFM